MVIFFEMLTNPQFDKGESGDGQILLNFVNELMFDGSRRGKKTTKDRTVLQRYPCNDFLFCRNRVFQDDFHSQFDEFSSTSASGLKTSF